MEAALAREHAPSSFILNVHAAPGSVQAAFLRRAMSALERIAGSASTQTLTDALAASTDVGSLAQLLSRSDVVGFHQGEILPGIADVVHGFATAGPWAALDFLLASDTVLGGSTPLQVLQSGDRDRVLRLVRSSRGDGFT